ncbi:hypothetical protein BC629DRAFT_1463756 [Irpex lacteus]|nr:hypothetical protein BC629DRAFT_1463756 [Irpex lacteus]
MNVSVFPPRLHVDNDGTQVSTFYPTRCVAESKSALVLLSDGYVAVDGRRFRLPKCEQPSMYRWILLSIVYFRQWKIAPVPVLHCNDLLKPRGSHWTSYSISARIHLILHAVCMQLPDYEAAEVRGKANTSRYNPLCEALAGVCGVPVGKGSTVKSGKDA